MCNCYAGCWGHCTCACHRGRGAAVADAERFLRNLLTEKRREVDEAQKRLDRLRTEEEAFATALKAVTR